MKTYALIVATLVPGEHATLQIVEDSIPSPIECVSALLRHDAGENPSQLAMCISDADLSAWEAGQ